MAYTQTWTVLSGSIPWVTIGLPNSHYQVTGYSNAAGMVRHDDSNGFTGVRVDLDRTYQPGESFTIGFTVIQNNLLERLPDEGIWRIDFTPGWYDRATIEQMAIRLDSPVDTASFTKLSPAPNQTTADTLLWRVKPALPGARFRIIMESTDGSFLAEGAGVRKGGGIDWSIVIGVVVVLALVALVIWRWTREKRTRLARRVARFEQAMAEDEGKKEEYESGFKKYVEENDIKPDDEGRYYDRKRHEYITPAIWAAVIYQPYLYQRPFVSGGYRNTTGCVSCACVSCACACACACAGGGAAGCARKTLHECPACRSLEQASREEPTGKNYRRQAPLH